MSELVALKKIIKQSNNIVFFGGAGVSTESNILDFRSKEGLYNQKKYEYDAETILSHDFFFRHNDYFYKYYFENMLNLDALPNKAHYALTKLEKMGKLKAVITQNIDGLHQLAKTKNVLELHGSVNKNYCLVCHNFMDAKDMIKNQHICNKCGGMMKPDVVLYQESLNEEILEKSIKYIKESEVLIIGGTSLNVYPAASLIQFFKGKYLILINKDKTPYDNLANIVIHDSIGYVLDEVSKDFVEI